MNFTRLLQAVCLVLSISVFSAAQGLTKQTPAEHPVPSILSLKCHFHLITETLCHLNLR